MLPRNPGMFNCVTLSQNRNSSTAGPVLPSFLRAAIDSPQAQPAAKRPGQADVQMKEPKMFRRFAALLTLCAGLALATPEVLRAQQAAVAASGSAPNDLSQLETEAQGWLSDLIHIDTTNPPGNEAEAAKYVAAVLQRENIPNEIIEIAPGRSITIGRLQ